MDTRVTVLIKALNEERHIRRCLISALAAVERTGGEVILCDSGSSDQTIAISRELPVTVIQLKNFAERSCGLGVQLGFPLVETPYLYVLDGDMELDADFLPKAVGLLQKNPRLAGVAGLVEELGGGNYEFEARKAENDGRQLGAQKSLDMGGLYRTDVIVRVGYLTNRNLHSYEEKELGLRLLAAGYSLERVGIPAVRHYGKTEDTAALLIKRWRSHHLDGSGEWLRASLGSRQAWTVCRTFARQLIVAAGWMLLLIGIAGWRWSSVPFTLAVIFQVALLAWFVIKKGVGMQAVFGFVNMQISSAALLRGLFRAQRDPAAPIASQILSRAPSRQASNGS